MGTDDRRSVKLTVRVIPGAPRDEFSGVRDGRAVVRLQARPVKGAANKALIEFLSETLQASPQDIHIVAGHHSRNKTLRVVGLTAAQLKQRLRQGGAL